MDWYCSGEMLIFSGAGKIRGFFTLFSATFQQKKHSWEVRTELKMKLTLFWWTLPQNADGFQFPEVFKMQIKKVKLLDFRICVTPAVNGTWAFPSWTDSSHKASGLSAVATPRDSSTCKWAATPWCKVRWSCVASWPFFYWETPCFWTWGRKLRGRNGLTLRQWGQQGAFSRKRW